MTERATSDRLILAVPSKGRLMEQTQDLLARAGLTLRKTGSERGYRGEVQEIPEIEVAYVSASEIAHLLKTGEIHIGVTGEDLVREAMLAPDESVRFLRKLGFGQADVVVAVPDCWLDVRRMADIEEMALSFRRLHGRRLKVATKYTTLTRRFFARNGVSDYRIVESLGATEGAPGAGTADLIVDITTTGATLAANGLRILDDGIILQSEANLVESRAAEWSTKAREAEAELVGRLAAVTS
jgi:ATP phosphoribosyltransferase